MNCRIIGGNYIARRKVGVNVVKPFKVYILQIFRLRIIKLSASCSPISEHDD
jgi:hypothetical protein